MKNLVKEGISVISLNIVSQVIVFGCFIYIAKVYPETEIGEYFGFGALAAILGIASTGYYEKGIYLVRRESSIQSVVILTLIVCIVVSTLSSLIAGYFLSDIYYFLGLPIFAAGLTKIFSVINIRQSRITYNTILIFLGTPIVPVLMIVNAKFGVTSSSYMIAITSLTSVSVSLISFFVVCRASRLHFSIKIARKTIRLYAAKYIDFVRFSTVAEVFSTASFRLPIFFASEFFDKIIAATYGVVVRLAISPIIIVLGYFSQRFLSDISDKARNNRNPKAIFVMYTKILFFYASVQALTILFFIDYVFRLAFGDSFKNGPEMMILMLPWLTGMCIVEPMGNIFLVYERQDIIFKNKFISFVISGLSFLLGWLFSDFMLGLKVFSWTMALFYVVVWIKAFHIANSHRLNTD